MAVSGEMANNEICNIAPHHRIYIQRMDATNVNVLTEKVSGFQRHGQRGIMLNKTRAIKQELKKKTYRKT